jgi:hypothetical protein
MTEIVVKKFSQFGINRPDSNALKGEKIKINKVLNRPIIIERALIEPSNFKENGDGKRLSMQIQLNGEQRLLWSGSQSLKKMYLEMQEKQIEFPIEVTITEDNQNFYFN